MTCLHHVYPRRFYPRLSRTLFYVFFCRSQQFSATNNIHTIVKIQAQHVQAEDSARYFDSSAASLAQEAAARESRRSVTNDHLILFGISFVYTLLNRVNCMWVFTFKTSVYVVIDGTLISTWFQQETCKWLFPASSNLH